MANNGALMESVQFSNLSLLLLPHATDTSLSTAIPSDRGSGAGSGGQDAMSGGSSSSSSSPDPSQQPSNSMMMHMTFYWGRQVSILFDAWRTDKTSEYGLALLAIFIACLLHQFLTVYRAKLEASSSMESTAAASRKARSSGLVLGLARKKLSRMSRERSPFDVEFMADMQRRLPLLLLVVVVFVFVVFLYVCLSCRPWKQRPKRRVSAKGGVLQEGRPMAGIQARAVLPAAEGGRKSATTEPSRRYDPSMYSHLPLWETPLPPLDEEPEGDELPTFPLGSVSTQLLLQTVLAGGSASNGRGEYTTLLQQGLGDDDTTTGELISVSGYVLATSAYKAVHICGGASVTGGVGPSAAGRHHGSSAPSADRLTTTCPARDGVAVGSLRSGGTLHSMPKTITPAQLDLRDDDTCSPAVRPTPSVENITRGVSNMRAHSDGGDDDGGAGDDADERFGDDVEAGDDDDDIPIRPLGKTGGRGRGRSRGAVRDRSVGRGGRGGVSDDSGESVTYWTPEEQMQLVRCKREQEMHLAGLGHNYGRMRTKEWKWDDIAKRMANAGRPKEAEDCMKKWDNIFQIYKKVQRFQNASGRPDFFRLSNEERKEHNFKFRMERALVFSRLREDRNDTALWAGRSHVPPSTMSFPVIQKRRRGRSICERLLKSCASQPVRMSSSPRRCMQYRSPPHLLQTAHNNDEVVQACSPRIAVIVDLPFFSPPVFSPRSTLAVVFGVTSSSSRRVVLSSSSSSIFYSSRRGGPIFCLPRLRRRLLPMNRSLALGGGPSSSFFFRWREIFCLPRARRRRHATAARETCFPLIRSHRTGRPQNLPRNISTRGNTRGKKRDVVVDDSQGQGRGRRQAPKAKRLRTEDASATVPRRGAQGWAAAAEGDYDDEFTTEEEQAEATTSDVHDSSWQRSSDHTASKRMLTPPLQAQQLRGCETRIEKAPVVDLGGDDDEPLERRRIRIRTTATPPEVAVRVAANERPVSIGAEEGGAAGAGGSGTVGAVATTREEATVGATAKEEARGDKKGDREAGEPGSSRVRRSVMTKDLIDRAVLWVDDKALWTTGEGRRPYNIVHDTREYFVAIASGLPPPAVLRSVVLPKSSTRVGKIVDQSAASDLPCGGSGERGSAHLARLGIQVREPPKGIPCCFPVLARILCDGRRACYVVRRGVVRRCQFGGLRAHDRSVDGPATVVRRRQPRGQTGRRRHGGAPGVHRDLRRACIPRGGANGGAFRWRVHLA
ncbi:hypothetical protein CBR_g10995 [Chara braunii]|uniref:Myb-like domain-containing protein n=1 Tax=Chara braunii TaxID=69332 RepID=A0A388KPR4_CHABU|nr:hypothetical protein CBR_g10995 [Chara braunii]|eukprot:GBG72060.1 hypothetical protein CBR_g10995 [Chara braunii]